MLLILHFKIKRHEKKSKIFGSFLATAVLMLFYTSCKKEQEGDKGITATKVTSEELLAKIKAF
jgi:hypothetical protein